MSQSAGRKKLLHDAGIAFECITHTCAETRNPRLSLAQQVSAIAIHKMACAILPVGFENKTMFVLTADTLGCNSQGTIYGKPHDRQSAHSMIESLQGSGSAATAFCLDRKKFCDNSWHTDARIERVVQTTYEFEMSDYWIDYYLDYSDEWLSIAGGISIEGFGAQFVKEIRGSYTAIVGLPMLELSQALEQLGFYNNE